MSLRKLSPYMSIILVYILIILLGALVLTLPISSKSGQWTSLIDSIFTATSATAVTGLVVVDTATYWSLFGQLTILILIQIGGMGVMTIVSLLHLFISKQISMYETNVLMQSAGSLNRNEVKKIIKRVLSITIICEAIGAVILTVRFSQDYALGDAMYKGVFHSVSAFCNAGFDVMGNTGQLFVSLTNYAGDYTVNIVIMLLITFGGVGFIVWNDILEHGIHIKKYKLHSKLVLLVNTILVFGGALIFFVVEYNNTSTIGNMTPMQKILASMFQSVTTRTAGFNTIDIASLTPSSQLLTMVLMMIGGGAGGTAGGIKITTFAVLIVTIFAVARNKKDITIFKKRIPETLSRQALALFFMWMTLTTVGSIIMCIADEVTLAEAVFETFSALGTVGLSTGITPQLSIVSKIVLPILMFVGRVGIATLLIALAKKKNESTIRKPLDNILIG